MSDPGNMGNFCSDDKRIIEDLVKKQAADFTASCNRACDLYRVVTRSNTDTEFEEVALSNLVQYKVIVQIGGNLVADMIRHDVQPTKIFSILEYQQRAILLKGMEQANVKSSLIEALKGIMKDLEKENMAKEKE